MKKVLIILPYKIDTGAKQQQIDFVYQTYIRQLVSRGVLPVLCSTKFSEEMMRELYKNADGVLLVGGADISPSLYNESAEDKTKVTNPKRDDAEKLIIELVKHDKKPLLGICRGMQIVNCVLGGSLTQDLADAGATESHMVPEGSSYDDVATYHGNTISVLSDTRLAELVGAGEHPVNCAHHQGVKNIGQGLRVCATSPEGLPEALESEDQSHFLFLVQNHIETQDTDFSKKCGPHLWQRFNIQQITIFQH